MSNCYEIAMDGAATVRRAIIDGASNAGCLCAVSAVNDDRFIVFRLCVWTEDDQEDVGFVLPFDIIIGRNAMSMSASPQDLTAYVERLICDLWNDGQFVDAAEVSK